MAAAAVMKLGLISDIHGNSPALGAVLPALLREADQVLFLGDLFGYYPFVEECVAMWDAARIVGVRGNHDQVLLDCVRSKRAPSAGYQARYGSALERSLRELSPAALALVESLPVTRTLDLEGRRLALYHGAPWDPLEGRLYPDSAEWDRVAETPADIILLGQTHHPFEKRHRGKLIINPGSVGQSRDRGGDACSAVLDLPSGEVQLRRSPFDSRRLLEDARAHDPELPYLVEVLTRR
jgi:putative phosphoesterase